MAVGAYVSGVAVGARVVLSFGSCGTCRNCQVGHPAYCATFFRRKMSGGRSTARHRPSTRPVGPWPPGSASRRLPPAALAGPHNIVVVDQDLPLPLLGPLGCGDTIRPVLLPMAP